MSTTASVWRSAESPPAGSGVVPESAGFCMYIVTTTRT